MISDEAAAAEMARKLRAGGYGTLCVSSASPTISASPTTTIRLLTVPPFSVAIVARIDPVETERDKPVSRRFL